MTSNAMQPADEKEKDVLSALTVGFALVLGLWLFGEAFTAEWLNAIAGLSPWLIGLITLGIWGIVSLVTYILIRPAQHECRAISSARRAQPFSNQADANPTESEGPNERRCDAVIGAERDKVAALTAGLAIMIAIWITALSFMPQAWLDSIGRMPPGFYCAATIILWAVTSTLMYLVFRVSSSLPPFRKLLQYRFIIAGKCYDPFHLRISKGAPAKGKSLRDQPVSGVGTGYY
jgi:hypothetical protein